MKRIFNVIIYLICIVGGIVVGFMGTTFIISFVRMVYHF